MLTLAVDTSTRSGSLALLDCSTVVRQTSIPADQPCGGQFQTCVDMVLTGSNIPLRQLDLFAVARGPGSFTGLRVGLTAVKAWAEVLQKPIVAVSVLEAIASQVDLAQMKDGGSTFVVPVLDARRGQVFGGVYENSPNGDGLRLIGEEIVDDATELVRLASACAGVSTLVFCSATPEAIEPALRASNSSAVQLVQVSPILAPTIGILGYRKALSGQTVDALGLDASYVRRTDAEMKWKGFAV